MEITTTQMINIDTNLFRILNDEQQNDKEHRQTDALLIQQAFEIINANLANPIVISAIADSLYVSESKLYKTFMSYYGESPKKLFTRYKIHLSQVDLDFFACSLDSIAIKYGFGNGCQYSKCFKKVIGYSPRKIA